MPNTIDGRGIIEEYTKNRMSTRPEFYSGRGAITSDLNSPLLEMIYGGVKKEFGDEAAAKFVQFIYDFGKLSATAFLNAFYDFIDAGCNYTPRGHSSKDDVDLGPDQDGREIIGMATIFGAMLGNTDRDETESIRGEFLWKHPEEYKVDQKREKSKRGVTVFGNHY